MPNANHLPSGRSVHAFKMVAGARRGLKHLYKRWSDEGSVGTDADADRDHLRTHG